MVHQSWHKKKLELSQRAWLKENSDLSSSFEQCLRAVALSSGFERDGLQAVRQMPDDLSALAAEGIEANLNSFRYT